MRSLEQEFEESTNGIRVELNRLSDAGMLISEVEGNKKIFKVNKIHPLYNDVNSIVKKYLGLDKIVEHVVEKLGGVRQVFLQGKLAQGLYSDTIVLSFVGDIDESYLEKLIQKLEEVTQKSVEFSIDDNGVNLLDSASQKESMLLWEKA